MGLTQESMTNSYLLTKDGVIVSRDEFQQIITSTFPDSTTEEITTRIASLFKRLERTRSEKLTADGTPYHQHLINNAVTVKLADLYQSIGFASRPGASSSSSCLPPSSELRLYQRMATDALVYRHWQEQFDQRTEELGFGLEESKEPEDFQQWMYQRFAAARRPSVEALALLTGDTARERIVRLRELRDQMAELRRQYRDATDRRDETEDGEDIRAELRSQIKELTAQYNDDKFTDAQRLLETQVTKDYNEWMVEQVTIDPKAVASEVETLVRREEGERHYASGRELFSILFPDDYFYSKENGADPLEPVLRIEEGIQVSGQHNKGTLGATHASIIGDLFKMYSPSHAEDLISRAKWLSDAWARTRGLSLTLYTCQTLDPSFSDLIKDKIRAAKIDAFKLGPRSNNPLEEARRQEVLTETFRNLKNSSGACAVSSIAKNNPDNALVVMSTSGSKGNKENISSIMTMVGQQEFQGRPIPLLPGGRSVPTFERNSQEAGARGMVEHNYLEGMTPAEFFLHQYSAREGLFGTALKTAETGYMQRRILKAMEDAVVYPDNTVRNAQGVVIQYAYGEDGFSGDQLVMTKGRARFIDARRMLSIIQSRRKRGLDPLFKPPTTTASRVLPRPGFRMPSFTEKARPTAVVEEEDVDDEEKKDEDGEKEDEEEPDEGADASDLSEGEEPEEED